MICAGGLNLGLLLVVCDCTRVCDRMLDLYKLLLCFFLNVGVLVVIQILMRSRLKTLNFPFNREDG